MSIVEFDETVILAPVPLITELVVMPRTSPTAYPVPLPAIETVETLFDAKVIFAVAPLPDPVIL